MPELAAQTAAVIPCYNESRTIAAVVLATKHYVDQVIVVDDGSTDETAALAEEAGAIVIRHGRNEGKGAALAKGFRRAIEHGRTWALCLDGDGQHDPNEIPKFFAAAQTSGAQMVVGNRMGGAPIRRPEAATVDTRMPWVRRVVNTYMSRRLSKLAGQSLPDSQCGFRLLNLTVWSDLKTHTTRFEIESELTVAFAQAGHKIGFVPIRVIYKEEQSKIHPLKDTIRWFRWLWRRSA